MLKKLSEKLRATMCDHSVVKVARLDDVLLKFFLTGSKPSRRSINAAKRKEKGENERPKK